MTLPATAALLVAALALAGCAVPGPAGGQPWAATVSASATTLGSDSTSGGGADAGAPGSEAPGRSMAQQLAGRAFLSTSIVGHELVPGSTIRIEFSADGTIGVGAGCNWMGGAASWDGDVLSVANMSTTEIGCEQPRAEQDRWLMGLLGAGVVVALTGDELTLTGGGATFALLDSSQADPDRPLEDTLWRLDGIVTGTGDSAAVSSVPDGIDATMRITDGRIAAFDGLNHIGIPGDSANHLTIDGDTVHVPAPGAMTAIGCAAEDGPPCFVDLSVLSSDFHYMIDANLLTVTGFGPTAGHGLMFRADAGPDGPPTASPTATATGPVVPSTVTAATSPGWSPEPSMLPGSAAFLVGHTYRLTRLFTDDGGADTRYRDARFTITFAAASATADSNCGTITYPHVRYYANGSVDMVDLDAPTGPACSLGSDPSGVPNGELMTGFHDGEYFLSTGYVGWHFHQVQ